MKKLINFAAMPFVAAVAACVLFFAVALIPQSAIQKNASESAKELTSQRQHPIILNTNEEAYKMDNYTDSQIIMQAYNLNMGDVSSILSNPKHVSQKITTDMAVALDEVVNGGAENEMNYVRYWMGFRIYIRPMLIFGSYYNIRRVFSVIYFVLLFIALVSLAKKVDVKTAVCFGISIALLNPSIVAQSLQYSCLFILSFVFIIYICNRQSNRVGIAYIFAAFGILTQFFDFYTTPIITWGLPLLVLLSRDKPEKPLLVAGKTLAAWGYGYVSMWIVKLLFTTLFTDINGFADGFKRFAERTGLIIMDGDAEKYNVIEALGAAWSAAVPGTAGKIVLVAAVAAGIAGIVIVWRTQKAEALLNYGATLVVAAVPIVWFIFTAQPTLIHAWFQHRSLAVFFFGGLLFVCSAAELLRSNLIVKKVGKEAL